MHTKPYEEQPKEIRNPLLEPPDPIPVDGVEEYEVDEILSHRKRGKGYQFLTAWKGYPSHDAVWLPSRNFIDSQGTINESFLKYIKQNDILHQHWKN